jgi:hypothetical protein
MQTESNVFGVLKGGRGRRVGLRPAPARCLASGDTRIRFERPASAMIGSKDLAREAGVGS